MNRREREREVRIESEGDRGKGIWVHFVRLEETQPSCRHTISMLVVRTCECH